MLVPLSGRNPLVNAPAAPQTLRSFDEAASAFRAFFDELREAFLERDELFTQLELALLCREHCLVIGPPGTAKSAVANAVLGRIVDEQTGIASLFSKQLAENTVQTDLIGPVDFKVLTETGRTEHLTDEGMLGAVHAFLDEVFDGRDMLLRSILNVLHERELKHGRKVTPGRCECAVMTSNRYLSEVLQRSPELLQAFADRISFSCFTPRGFARSQSRAQMLARAHAGQRPTLHERLTLQQLDVLQATVSAVEVPAAVSEGIEVLSDALERQLQAQASRMPDYVPTKYFSQRTMVKALWALKAIVVRDRLYRQPERPLVAELDDLPKLDSFFLLAGPTGPSLETLIKGAVDPRERAQLEIVRVEQRAFAEALQQVRPQLEQSATREADALTLRDELAPLESLKRQWSAAVASTVAQALARRLLPGPRHPENRAPLVRAAEQLLLSLDARAHRGSAASEGRSGAAHLRSFVEVLELMRRVPELKERVPAVAAAVRDDALHVAQLISLGAEEIELEDTLRLELIAGVAKELSSELSRVREVLQLCETIGVDVSAARPRLAEAGQRTALALKRRAGRSFDSTSGGEPLERLSLESQRLRELETVLTQLAPHHGGLRLELLAPLGVACARSVLEQPAERLDDLVRAVEALVENLEREGVEPSASLRAVREELEQGVAKLGAWTQPDAQLVPGDPLAIETYQTYRAKLAAAAPEAPLVAHRALSLLLERLQVAPLRPELREGIVASELTWLVARVRYLRAWLSKLLERVPDTLGPEQAFERFLKSRFPMLVMRDGELVKLSSAAARLGTEPGEQGALARKVAASLELLAEEFQQAARQLLDARAARVT